MTTAAPEVAPPPERFNIAEHLLAQNAGRPDKPAFIDEQGAVSYGQLAERTRRLASALKSLYLRREERVLVLMHDSTDWPVAFLGSLYAGLVPVAVNTLLTADDYAYMLEHSRAQAVLVSGALLPTLTAAMVKSDHEVQKVIVSRPLRRCTRPRSSSRPSWPPTPRPTSPHPRAPMTRPSGSIPAALPAAPRARCIRTPTRTGPASCTPSGCWA